MEAQLVKWGNGQGIRIPKLILKELDIKVNDTLSMEVRGEQIIIEKVKFKHRSLEERARAYGGKLGKRRTVCPGAQQRVLQPVRNVGRVPAWGQCGTGCFTYQGFI